MSAAMVDEVAAYCGGTSCTVDLGGPVHYVDFGGPPQAPPLVFVHGLGGSHLNWAMLAPMVSAYVRPIAVDLAGFGLTPPMGRPASVTGNSRLLLRFIEEVVGRPAVLAGNSMGGMVCILAAARNPALADRMVLINSTLPRTTGGSVSPTVRNQFLALLAPGLGEWALSRYLATFTAAERVKQVMDLCCADPLQIPDDMMDAAVLLEELRADEPGRAAAHLAATRSMLRQLAWPGAYLRRMRSVTVPVLLIHGAHDRLVPVAAARRAVQRLPHWTLAELDAGHVPQLEAPRQVADRMISWLHPYR